MKKKPKLPKNWGKLTKEVEVKNIKEYILGFNDGWEVCKEVMKAKKKLKAKKK